MPESISEPAPADPPAGPSTPLRPLGAGEGGRLPRGLSLFRFFLFCGLMLGALYGGASLYFNSAPPPGYTNPQNERAADWQPSPLWLPSWMLFKLQLGVAHTEDGYAFRSPAGHALFGSLGILIGILLGGTLGWTVGEQARRHVLRKRARQI